MLMAAEKEKLVKEVKEEEEEEDDDEDYIPIALSTSKLPKKREPKREDEEETSKLPKKREPKREDEEEEDEDDRALLSRLKANKKKLRCDSNGAVPSSNAKVKKEEQDEDYDEKPRKKETNTKRKEEGKGSAKSSKVKKEESNGVVDDEDEKVVIKKIIKKVVVEEKKKTKVSKAAKVVTESNGSKKVKKVYDLPGQKHDPPEERDPLRIFYETLYQQVPNSEMAAFWMMEWGLLSAEDAMKVYEKKPKKNQLQKLNSPMNVVSVQRTSNSKAVFVKKTLKSYTEVKKASASKTASMTSKKRKVKSNSSDEDDDEDFIL